MKMETAKKYLPEGRNHIIETQFSDEELAKFIDALFFKEKEGVKFPDEKTEAEHYLIKKEVAYQTIRRLAGGKNIPAIIQSEKDWIRYFQLEHQGDS